MSRPSPRPWHLRGVSALVLLMLAACHDKPAPQSPPDTRSALTVEGSALVLTLPSGEVLRGTALQGATVHLAYAGQEVPMKLASITQDPSDALLLRYDFQVPDDHGGWQPACEPNAAGERWGFPIALPEGHPGREGAITMTCVSGAVGKCARFGYKPWVAGKDGSDTVALHAACVRMVRADYCGDGVAHTRNGTEIDVFDDAGIQTSDAGASADFAFEAGWTPQGAACVAHTRWAAELTLAQLHEQCPRLAQATCDAASARAAGARLFNRSRIQ